MGIMQNKKLIELRKIQDQLVKKSFEINDEHEIAEEMKKYYALKMKKLESDEMDVSTKLVDIYFKIKSIEEKEREKVESKELFGM